MTEQYEHHQPQNIGWFIPRDITEFLETREMTCVDVVLWAMLHSFSKKEEGCFASNAWLAERIGVSVRRVEQIVSKLKKLGVIKATKKGSRRRLHTCCDVITKFETPQSNGRARNGARNNRTNAPVIIVPHTSISTNNTIIRSCARNDSSKISGLDVYSEKCAKLLNTSLHRKNKIMGKSSIKTWTSQFQKMLSNSWDDRKRIKKVLVWYCENIGKQYIPTAYSAKAFIEKFIKIEDAMHRNSDGVDVREVKEEDLLQELFKRTGQGGPLQLYSEKEINDARCFLESREV